MEHLHYRAQAGCDLTNCWRWPAVGGGLIGYVKSKLLGNGQIISIDVLVIVMIIAVFHKKVDLTPGPF